MFSNFFYFLMFFLKPLSSIVEELLYTYIERYIAWVYIYICMYIYLYRSFSITLDKSLRKNIKRKRNGETGKHEMGALNMKQIKWNKQDKVKDFIVQLFLNMASHWKHIWSFGEKQQYLKKQHLYFSKTSRIILIHIWILKSDYKFFYKMVVLVI